MLYKIDKTTNELKGSYPSNEDGYIPKGFTDVEPFPAKSGFINIWNGTAWELVEDFRGRTIYSTKTGEPLTWWKIEKWNKEQYTELEPPKNDGSYKFDNGQWIAKTAEELREEKREDVKASNPNSFELFGTLWGFDLLSQWAIQLAENQAINHNKKVIAKDLLGEWHELSRYKSNKLQKAMFNKYLQAGGYNANSR